MRMSLDTQELYDNLWYYQDLIADEWVKIGAPKTWGEWFGTNKRQLTDVAMITRVI